MLTHTFHGWLPLNAPMILGERQSQEFSPHCTDKQTGSERARDLPRAPAPGQEPRSLASGSEFFLEDLRTASPGFCPMFWGAEIRGGRSNAGVWREDHRTSTGHKEEPRSSGRPLSTVVPGTFVISLLDHSQWITIKQAIKNGYSTIFSNYIVICVHMYAVYLYIAEGTRG